MPNFTKQEDINKAIDFLKNLSIKKFYSFEKIDEMFKLGLNTARRKLKKYFRVATGDIFVENNICYYSMKGLADYLIVNYSRLRHVFAQINPPHVKIHFQSKQCKKISVKKYYDIKKILHLLPQNFQKAYYTMHNSKFERTESALDLNLTDLEEIEYIVFRSLIEFYKKEYFWPSIKQLNSFIGHNFNKIKTDSAIYRIIGRLIKKGYISIKRVNKYYTVYFIHKGPLLLTHKLGTCYDTAFGKSYDKFRVPIDTFFEHNF